jgi:hypothetical protein
MLDKSTGGRPMGNKISVLALVTGMFDFGLPDMTFSYKYAGTVEELILGVDFGLPDMTFSHINMLEQLKSLF